MISQLPLEENSKIVLHSLETLIKQLSNLNGQQLSLADLLKGTHQLQPLLNLTISSIPGLLQSILQATISAPSDQINKLISSQNPIGYLCNMTSDQLALFWKISKGPQLLLMHELLCSVNTSTLTTDLLQVIGLKDVLNISATNTNVSTTALQKLIEMYATFIMNMQENVNKTYFQLPQVDVAELEKIINSFLANVSTNDMNQLSKMISHILSSLQGIPEANNTIGIAYQMYMTIMDYVNRLLDSLISPDQTFQLMSLFKNAPAAQSLIMTAFNLSSDFVPLLSQTSINLQSVSYFVLDLNSALFQMLVLISSKYNCIK